MTAADDDVVDRYGQILAYADTASIDDTLDRFGMTREEFAGLRALECSRPDIAASHEAYRAQADDRIEALINRALMLGLRKLERSFSERGPGCVDMRLPASLAAVSDSVTKLRELQVSRQILAKKDKPKP